MANRKQNLESGQARYRGFNVLELLVLLAVVAMLAAILVPAFVRA